MSLSLTQQKAFEAIQKSSKKTGEGWIWDASFANGRSIRFDTIMVLKKAGLIETKASEIYMEHSGRTYRSRKIACCDIAVKVVK